MKQCTICNITDSETFIYGNKNKFTIPLCKKHYNQFLRQGKAYATKYDSQQYEVECNYALIIICQKHSIIKTKIDLEDVGKCKKFKWNVAKGYVKTNIDGHILYLHRYLLNINDKNIKVDHVDRDILNNQKSNLRLCSQSENSKNIKLIRINNTSGHKGITWDKQTQKWVAQIVVNYKNIKLGRFNDVNEAIKVRNEAELYYFDKFSPLYNSSI